MGRAGGSSNRGGGGGGSRGGAGRTSSSSSDRAGSTSSNNNYFTRHSSYTKGYRGYSSYGGGRRGGAGLALVIVVLCVFGFISNFIGGFGDNSKSSDINYSTVKREALPKGSVNETSYYTDKLGWIENKTSLEKGLKHFYKKTGVQPHIYITDDLGSDIAVYADKLYSELFTDEAHCLLVFKEKNEVYTDYVITGTQAKQVIDNEAVNILLDYVDRYYYSDKLSESEFFSRAFKDSADRIMKVTTNPKIMLYIIIAVIILVIVLIIFIRYRSMKKKEEDDRIAELLRTPIESSTEEDDGLEDKYNN